MKFIQNYFFLFLFLSTFHLPIMSRPTPRQTLSLGGRERKILRVLLNHFPATIYANMSIGDPSVNSLLNIDTGSDLTWVLYFPHFGYDPQSSFSFSYKSCDGLSKSPYVAPSKTRGQCNYKQRLADDAVYEGTLGIETFTFGTGDGGLGELKNVLFGFGKTRGSQVGHGTLGLNVGELSILKSIGERFSICIGNFNDIARGGHFLALGDDAVFVGEKVSLDTKENPYGIELSSIIIDGENLGIENVLSKSTSILDTGSSTISLVRDVYRVVIDKIKKKMTSEGYKESDIYKMFNIICYKGTLPTEIDLEVTLKFGKVTLDMEVDTLFVSLKLAEKTFCLSVNESPLPDKNLLGIPIFQRHNIGFDIPNMKVYIKPVDCKELYDSYRDELVHHGP